MLDLVWENRFCSINKEERGFACRPGGGGAGGPQHGLELVVPAPAAGLQLLLEGPGLEAPQDLCVGALSLTIAPGVSHRSIADLRSKVSTIGFEEVTGELRAVIGDDAVGDPKTAHETLDELDRGASWDGADGFCRISGSGRPLRFEHWGARGDFASYLPAPLRLAKI